MKFDYIKDSGYSNALTRVLNLRFERMKIYGNQWKTDEDWVLLALIKQKLGRLQDFIINKKDTKLYENEIDTLIDLINYSLFLLENKLNSKKEK